MRKTPYTFLLAASHSGSTLLAMLLNAHPDVATVGELTSGAFRNLNGYRCSCRRPLVECPFWQGITTRMRPRFPAFNLSDFGIRFELSSPRWVARLVRIEHRGRVLEAVRDAALALSSTWRRHFRQTAVLLDALAREILAQSGARVIVDSSKLAHRLKFVRRMPNLDVKVIHLVRDGRAVALTYMDADTFADATDPTLRRGGRGLDGPASQPRLPMTEAATEWLRSMRSAEHVLADHRPDQWMRVRYEDLCTNPVETLARIYTFLGVDPSRAAAAFRSVEHHIVGNGMRLDAHSEITLDDRWTRALGADDLAAFDRVAGDVNRRYGASDQPLRTGQTVGSWRASTSESH
jgi:Sulfotransferase family